jgi:putative transposase
MSNKSIGKKVEETSNICSRFESVTFNSIRKALPDRVIIQACVEAGHRYRIRRITPVLTVLHMIVAAIWPEDSFVASWQLLWSSFVAAFPYLRRKSPSRGVLANARKRLPLAVWNKIVAWLCQESQEHSELIVRWRSHRVVAADGTCLTLPATEELCDTFGLSKGNDGIRRYPLVKLVCLSLLETMTVINYRLGCYTEDENSLLAGMLKSLRKGDILVADRHYAGANLYWNYMENGLQYLTQLHQRQIVSRLKRLWSYCQDDFVAKLKIGDAYRRKNPAMPKYITARFIRAQACIRGKYKSIWLATSLLDAAQYPADEVAELYLKRWRIETLFGQLKVNCNVDLLRSKTTDGVHKEVAAGVCAVNIVRIIMLEAAAAGRVDVMRISFVAAVRAIIAFAPALALQPVWRLPMIYEAMLAEIASHLVPERPGRLEPRKVTHDPRGYPKLMTTRAQWRKQYAA